MNQSGNDIQKKTFRRRTFLSQALLISAGGIVGLNLLNDKFKLPSSKVSSTRVKYKRKLPPIAKKEGFYINQKKNNAVIYYLSSFDKESFETYSPSLKTVPPKKMGVFIDHLKEIDIGEVNKLLQNQKNVLLSPVWAAERLSKGIQKAQFIDYLNFVDTLLIKGIVENYYSRIKLLDFYLKIYILDIKKNKYPLKKKLDASEKKFLQQEKENKRKEALKKYIYSK